MMNIHLRLGGTWIAAIHRSGAEEAHTDLIFGDTHGGRNGALGTSVRGSLLTLYRISELASLHCCGIFSTIFVNDPIVSNGCDHKTSHNASHCDVENGTGVNFSAYTSYRPSGTTLPQRNSIDVLVLAGKIIRAERCCRTAQVFLTYCCLPVHLLACRR